MRKLIAVVSVLLAGTLLLAAAASAKGGRPARVLSGKCSVAGTWKLKVKADDARIETEFQVDQNRVGRRWSVVLRRNGAVVFRGTRTTTAPSGSFTVRKLVAGATGARITASARALATHETCSGSAAA